ncbi:MAG: hypothetical protein OSJ60_10325 [Lachnospiraceae bacterium]|nr:hypothetical protein [Lachnospiraceae bacterium]
MGANICPYCGAYLDPDEKCDCREEEVATSQKKILTPAKANQDRSNY